MIASLAGAIALVTHGNRYLRGVAPEPPDLMQNSAFKFAHSLHFYTKIEREVRWWERIPGLRRPAKVDPIEGSAMWLRALRDQGARRLWLGGSVMSRQNLPAHVAVAFAGSTGWTLTPEIEGRNTMWLQTERLLRRADYNNPNDDHKIWGYSYYELGAFPISRALNVDAAREALDKALDSAIQFCGRTNSDWGEWLSKAQQQLSSDQPAAKYHSDMFPLDGMPLKTRQLGYAASSAWVFGGMGSWNDQVFENALQSEFDRVSRELYEAVLNGLVQSANDIN